MQQRKVGRKKPKAVQKIEAVVDLYGISFTAKELAAKAGVSIHRVYTAKQHLGYEPYRRAGIATILLENADPTNTIKDYQALCPPTTSYDRVRDVLVAKNIPYRKGNTGPSRGQWFKDLTPEQQQTAIPMAWLRTDQLSKLVGVNLSYYQMMYVRSLLVKDAKKYLVPNVLIDLATVGAEATAEKHRLDEQVLSDIGYVAEYELCPYTDQVVELTGFLANEYRYHVEAASHV